VEEHDPMKLDLRPFIFCSVLGGLAQGAAAEPAFRLVTLDPGHFHAALLQSESYPDVDDRVQVYAPLGSDLIEHLKRVARFNERSKNPTHWQLDVHTGGDPLQRMVADKAGNVVVISGKNKPKMDAVQAAVGAGFHALVDKPWILSSQDLPRLRDAVAAAEKNGRVAYDMMTERFELTTELQKELVNDPAVFGKIVNGTEAEPAVVMESVHHLLKIAAGAPLVRPAWFFDTDVQGEALSDVGTHLVDLVPWTLFPEQPIDAEKDIKILAAQRWPLLISKADFQRVTGEPDFPESLKTKLKDGSLEFFCNAMVSYTLRGVHVKLAPLWAWEAPAGSGDSHYAVYRGSKARIEVRQGEAEGGRPQTYVVPVNPKEKAAVLDAVRKRVAALQRTYPGVTLEEKPNGDILLKIPDALRTVHEDHFAQVARTFFKYAKDPASLPKWETSNLFAKYHVTTKGTELSRETPVRVASRLAPR
jgi:predicted dehydrogenase